MKKNLLLLSFLCIQTIVHAQFNVGSNFILQFPFSDFKQMSPISFGGCASVGYTINKRVDLSLVYSIYNYSGASELGLDSKTVETKFFFLHGNTRPYIGCSVGAFTKTINSNILPKYTENVWGFEPKLGGLFYPKILKNLFVDASISYLNANTKFNAPRAVDLSVGLKYYLNTKKNSR